MISGIITATLFVAFLCIVFWAWSARNREPFAEAANLPFIDEAPVSRDAAKGGRS